MDKGTATNINNNIKKTNENFADLLEESFKIGRASCRERV